MILEQTIEKLSAMKLSGMLQALQEWQQIGGDSDLEPTDLIGLMTDAEWIAREGRKLTNRLRQARFPMAANVEEIDYKHSRGLKKSKVLELLSCRWIAEHQNLIITGPTGIGKTFLPCALGNKACREGYNVLYTRAPRLFGELYLAKADGTYPRLLKKLAKVQLLIIDDFGCAPLESKERRDLREILEDRYDVSSTVITSQLDPKHWHSFIGDETIADAVCDRLVHNRHLFDRDRRVHAKEEGAEERGQGVKDTKLGPIVGSSRYGTGRRDIVTPLRLRLRSVTKSPITRHSVQHRGPPNLFQSG